MPEISRFFGIIIKMFVRGEHNPPHVHAIYSEYNAIINIKTGEIIEGDLPNKQKAQASKWTNQYKYELIEMWDSKQITKLPPLEED